ncbi:MAG: hypothetical protein LQ352_002968 [Teloschistes flavicans]|nr:MAG: hypothetical protein LQ352_002968 [Teloschistes flavicans]
MQEHDPLVSEYQHEKSRPREAEALQALRKVASLVKPIMRQRGWRVGILTEFYPPEQNLLGLNWNRGQKICLRLRYPGDERQFLPLEQVVDTMLHELCHNVHGPHNEAFHNLWNQLRDEHESLIRKGYTGEGFLSTGHKLGSSAGRIPIHEAQRRARAAAEKRRTLTAGSGQKLGGAAVRWGQDIRKVIADAAQRRIDIMRGCGDTDTARVKEIVDQTNQLGFKTKAEVDDADEEAIMLAYIDLVQEEEREKYGKDYIPPSKDNPAGSQGYSPSSSSSSSSNPFQVSRAPPVPTSTKPPSSSGAAIPTHIFDLDDPASAVDFSSSWTCNICTLVNPPNYLSCDACGTDRPSPPPSPQHPPRPTSSSSSLPSRPAVANGFNLRDRSKERSRIPNKTDKLDKIRLLNAEVERKAQTQPVGWECWGCGNWMENQWWTCGRCGMMKSSS